MQSAPEVPMMMSGSDLPTMIFVPAGQHETSSPSTAVTICVAVATLPSASTARKVTVVFPSGNLAGASLLIATVPPHAAVAVAVPIDGLLHDEIVTAGGAVIVGGTAHRCARSSSTGPTAMPTCGSLLQMVQVSART